MSITTRLDAFDGKRTAPLQALADEATRDAAAVRALCQAAGRDDPKRQAGATWVLKRFLEGGFVFSTAQTQKILALLGSVACWEAQLHILQMLPGLTIDASHAESVCDSATALSVHANKLVRAWAYNGLAVVADQHRNYRPGVRRVLLLAREDAAASVRARVRRLGKEFTWVEGDG